MPPLKAIEQATFGGVDSRSNPVILPQNRFLLMSNWVPRPDGHLELREGYTQQPLGLGMAGTLGPIHSMCPYTVAYHGPLTAGALGNPNGLPFVNGAQCIFFWIGTLAYLRYLDGGLCPTHNPVPRGKPVTSSARWKYALGKDGYLYMHNGTDAKFFDGVYLRDIGLPQLSGAQIGAISVVEGFAAPIDNPDATVPKVQDAAYSWVSNTGYLAPVLAAFPTANMYMAYWDKFTGILAPSAVPLSGAPFDQTSGTAPGPPTNIHDWALTVTGLPPAPTGAYPNSMTLLYWPSANTSGGASPAPGLICKSRMGSATLSMPFANRVNVHQVGHGLVTGSIIALGLFDVDTITKYTGPVQWSSNGPFAVTKIDNDNFSFNTTEAPYYAGAGPLTIWTVDHITGTTYTVPDAISGAPFNIATGIAGDLNDFGNPLIASPIDPLTGASTLIPASAIGGAQPGYQFFASIYDPLTGHVGNRVAIGMRIAPTSAAVIQINGLPDLSVPFNGIPVINWGNGTDLQGIIPFSHKEKQGELLAYAQSPGDTEWCLLIGRTGDGGEVPYAVIDSNGNWVYAGPGQTSITISFGQIDGNSELPVDNYIPPPFSCFWREGDRICGSLLNQPFVYRSGSEVDATTGIFVGLPGQSWSPARLETFPTAAPVWGGFGYMQESWVFTKGDLAQLSELSGEVAWNGPYNFSVIGPYAFDKGWQGLPFWISKDKQLCTMLPESNGPIVISGEYEASLLSKIGDDSYDTNSNLTTLYASNTQVVYFYDPLRKTEVLRIKCTDTNGNPFTIIHDFNLRDDLSPYGQAYEQAFLSTLATDYVICRILDFNRHQRMWAGGNDGRFYAFYNGGQDNGVDFPAAAITLRYISGDRTAVKTIEWYGDDQIKWYILDHMVGDDVVADYTQWVDVTDQMRPFPGDVESGHWQADVDRPEMIHCYLYIALMGHAADAPNPADPMALSHPVPHLPLETYGRLYLAAPILGDTRGR